MIYNKRQHLYGLQVAGHHIQKEGKAIIVEGYLDVLTLHQAGIKNAVAALGTALTEHQIQLLKRYTGDIITVFDADPAGEKAMARSLEPFLQNGLSPRVIVLPAGEDPDSFVRQQGGAAFQEKTAAAEYLLDFVVERIISRQDIASPRGKVAACDEIVPLLGRIADSLERELYEQKISRRIGVSQAQLRSRTGKLQTPRTAAPAVAAAGEKAPGPARHAELLLLKLLAAHPECMGRIDENIFEDFIQPDLKKLGLLMLASYRNEGVLDIPLLEQSMHEQSLRNLLAQVVFLEAEPEDPVKALEDCIRNIHLKKLAEEAQQISSGIKQAEAARDDASVIRLQQRHVQLKNERRKWIQFKLA